jgi:hypothetical protein
MQLESFVFKYDVKAKTFQDCMFTDKQEVSFWMDLFNK